MKLVVYCHGFAGSHNSSKVEAMKDAGIDVLAYEFDYEDYIGSMKRISDEIDNELISRMHQNIDLIFVGTSMGAVVAKDLARLYEASSVLVNPCFNPNETMAKLGQHHLVGKFRSIEFDEEDVIFVGTEDELIDFSKANFDNAEVYFVTGANHRFDVPYFDEVIEYLNER